MFYLKGVKDVLPDVEGSIGVSKGEYNKFRVNTDNAFDVNCLFLDDMGMDWFV